MTKTEYLYGVKADELPSLEAGLKQRLKACRELKRKLVYQGDMKDAKRLNAVFKAELWCERMLKEYEK